MTQNRGTPGGRPGGPNTRIGGGGIGGPGGSSSGSTGGSTGGQRNIGFGYTRPPARSTPASVDGERGAARVVGGLAGGAQTAAQHQFWVNHDPKTGVDRLHRTGCRHEQNKHATPLKGIDEDRYDGGWHPFATEADARAAFPNAVWCQDCV